VFGAPGGEGDCGGESEKKAGEAGGRGNER
jgi:hypothetical protein